MVSADRYEFTLRLVVCDPSASGVILSVVTHRTKIPLVSEVGAERVRRVAADQERSGGLCPVLHAECALAEAGDLAGVVYRQAFWELAVQSCHARSKVLMAVDFDTRVRRLDGWLRGRALARRALALAGALALALRRRGLALSRADRQV